MATLAISGIDPKQDETVYYEVCDAFFRVSQLTSTTILAMLMMRHQRDRLVEAWLREHPRKGLPAPWVSEKWKDDAWAVAQICGRDDRLSVEQVRAIRELARTHPAETITERIGARNKDQVQRVIDGETYTRVT